MTPQSQCPQKLSYATLSAWHDGFLASRQAERIARHIPDCPTCQSILAEFTDIAQRLNTLSEPAALHARLRQTFWSNLQPTLLRQGASNMSRSTTIRRIAAAVVAAALIIVFALTFHLFQHPSSASKAGSQPTSKSSPTTLWRPSDLVPLPNFPLTSGFESTPDGASIVGLASHLDVVAYGVSTQTSQTLVPGTQQTTSIATPSTDGRYISWALGTGEQNAQHQVITESDTLWVYDTQTQQRFALETFQRQPNDTTLQTFAYPLQTFQGMLLWEQATQTQSRVTASKLILTNLATRTDDVISANDGGVAMVSWPQLLYGVTDTHGAVTAHLKNLQTGADQALPNLPDGHTATILSAGHVYGTHESAINGTTSNVEVEELQNIGSPQARWETVITLTSVAYSTGAPRDQFLSINDQVIVYAAASGRSTITKIVDRATGQTMNVKTAELSQDRWLVMQLDDGSYALLDTAKLP